jgi:hypothetical protein
MNPTTVVVPKVGVVAFPNTMDGKAINDAVKSLHTKAVIKSVLKFVAKDPALVGLDTAEFYKQLSGIAAFLEKYSSLARAADAGIHGEKVHDLPTVDESLNEPVEPEPAPAEAASTEEPVEAEAEAPEEEAAEAQPEEAEAEPAAESPEAEAEPTK